MLPLINLLGVSSLSVFIFILICYLSVCAAIYCSVLIVSEHVWPSLDRITVSSPPILVCLPVTIFLVANTRKSINCKYPLSNSLF